MSRARLSHNIQCPIPVALPKNEYYDAGIPVFGIGNNSVWNRERPGELYTAWNFYCLKKTARKAIAIGTKITFLGVTTESTMGQDICSVQGAGVVNIDSCCFDDSIKARSLTIVDDLYVTYNTSSRSISKIKLILTNEDVMAIKIGRVHHVYYSNASANQIQSVDVRLNVGQYRDMTVQRVPLRVMQPPPAPAAGAPASVPSGGAPIGKGGGLGAGVDASVAISAAKLAAMYGGKLTSSVDSKAQDGLKASAGVDSPLTSDAASGVSNLPGLSSALVGLLGLPGGKATASAFIDTAPQSDEVMDDEASEQPAASALMAENDELIDEKESEQPAASALMAEINNNASEQPAASVLVAENDELIDENESEQPAATMLMTDAELSNSDDKTNDEMPAKGAKRPTRSTRSVKS
ncbi:MAG: hypothetical protein CL678_11850 [Bdellovibrionaceae bacterium]|nr:hypothetical protein [Pseudobdellovibrionaceae bacterium]